MRCSRLVLVAVVLAGCAAEVAPEPAGPGRDAQERACAVVVSDHVGTGVGEVTTAWSGVTADGVAVLTVRDTVGGGERVHTCEVDSGARVLAIRHPGQ